MRLRQLAILLSTSVLAASCCRSLSADTGRLELSIVAPEPPAKGAVVPARVHLLGPDGKAVRAPGLPFWKDHFNCDGKVDGFDLGRLLGFWGQASTDITGDGTTDGADLAVLLGAWTG